LTPICIKSFIGWGFAPDPTGELEAPPQTPWLYLGVLLLKGEERREDEGE